MYIGKSKRHLKIGACEHAGVSVRIGIILKCPQDSTIFTHFDQDDCAGPTSDDFTILCSAKNDLELQVRECNLISHEKPELTRETMRNQQGSHEKPELLLFFFILVLEIAVLIASNCLNFSAILMPFTYTVCFST